VHDELVLDEVERVTARLVRVRHDVVHCTPYTHTTHIQRQNRVSTRVDKWRGGVAHKNTGTGA
jgi:hypothetical protein